MQHIELRTEKIGRTPTSALMLYVQGRVPRGTIPRVILITYSLWNAPKKSQKSPTQALRQILAEIEKGVRSRGA